MKSDIHNFNKMLDFIESIKIPFLFCNIEQQTFLPGLSIEKGVLLIDKNKLAYIGDTLHEVGHIALVLPEERNKLSGSLHGQNNNDEAATEMAVIAWTYAACLKINILPEVVFHSEGYKGDSENILYNFKNGQYFGVPILQWYGMTNLSVENEQVNYPSMHRWVR